MQGKHTVHIQQLLADINKVINKNRNFNFLYNEAEIKTGRGCNYGNLGPISHLKILSFLKKKTVSIGVNDCVRGKRGGNLMP